MDKIVSFIVPAYNVSRYLKKNIESFLKESVLDKIEVVIVNDGSKDDTLQIAYRYQETYPNSIIVIDKENGGHGSAINAGLARASGRYFKVVDGDDWVNTEELSRYVDILEASSAEAVVCNFIKYYENMKREEKLDVVGNRNAKKESFANIDDEMLGRFVMHSVTYRTDILQKNHIRLDEHCFYVDVEFCLYPLRYVKDVEYSDVYLYVYRLERPGQSMSMESLFKNKMQHLYVMTSVYSEFFAEGNEVEDERLKSYVIVALTSMANVQYEIRIGVNVKNAWHAMRDLREFDKLLKYEFPLIYDRVNSYRRVLWLRRSQFVIAPWICIARCIKRMLIEKGI